MIELLRNRRSIRKFSDRPVSDADRAILEEAALRSPSSRGIDPWTFVFVDRPELIRQLAAAKKHGSTFLRGAPLAIVVCGDESRADTWVEDTSIASILLQLAAQSLGLGSCWIQIRLRQHADGASSEACVRELLGIPDSLRVESIIAVGHPAEHPAGHPAEQLDRTKIRHNRY